MTSTISIDAIPHRPPFRFVDEVVEVADKRIVTTKYVDPASDFFRGHYPGEPVMPGVLICECCFQAGALLVAHVLEGSWGNDGIPVVTRIRDARFKRIVRPGSTLRVEVALDEALDRAYFLTGRASVEQEPVARVSFACMLAQRQES